MRMKPVQCPTDLVRPSEFSIMHHESHVQPTWITQVIPKYWAQAMHKAASWCVFWEIFTNASAKSKLDLRLQQTVVTQAEGIAVYRLLFWPDYTWETQHLMHYALSQPKNSACKLPYFYGFSRTYHEYENKVNPQKTSGLKMLLGRGELESLNNIFHILLIKLMNHNILR